MQLFPQVRPRVREDSDGKERGVYGPGFTDRKRRDGNTRGHLYCRKQRIEPIQRLAAHWNAQNGQSRVRGKDAREMCGSSRRGDHYFQSTRFRRRSKLSRQRRRAMRRDHTAFVTDTKL